MHNMAMNHDFYGLFSAFWWLLFPLGWGIAAMVGAFLRHKRAQQALEVIQAFAQQGKEIPPDVLKVLQGPERAERSPKDRARRLMVMGFVLVAFSAAFAVFTIGNWLTEGDKDVYALVFVVALFAGIGGALLLSSRIMMNDNPP